MPQRNGPQRNGPQQNQFLKAPGALVRGAAGALALGTLVLTATAVAAAPRSEPPVAKTTPYQNPRMGFSFAYPTAVFVATKDDPTAIVAKHTKHRSGITLASRDGRAWLMAGAFANTGQVSSDDYRARVLAKNYADARITYQRSEDGWFLVSGFRGKDIFYDRVNFTCGGRVITVWGLFYPAAERQTYDRIVESLAQNFKPGESREHCQ